MQKFLLNSYWLTESGLQVQVIAQTNLKRCEPYVTFKILGTPRFLVRLESECKNFKPMPKEVQ